MGRKLKLLGFLAFVYIQSCSSSVNNTIPPEGSTEGIGTETGGTETGGTETGGAGSTNTESYNIKVTVSGLGSGITLLNNGTDALNVTADGEATFATKIATNAAYAVTLQTDPADRNCVISNGSGTVASNDITNITVTCIGPSFLASVTGLAANTTLKIALISGSDSSRQELTLTAPGNFKFPNNIAEGTNYTIVIPSGGDAAGQYCGITPDQGTLSSSPVNVNVSCEPVTYIFVAPKTSGPNDGDLGGLAGADNLCNDSHSRPDTTKQYAAVIASSTRHACTSANCTDPSENSSDWPLKPNTKYFNSKLKPAINTTNSAGIFTQPFSAYISASSLEFWTGMDTDWTAGDKNCNDWTSSSAIVTGKFGYDNTTFISTTIGPGVRVCGSSPNNMHVICAQID